MAVGERQTQKQRRKTPSFSSSLLDAICHSIDDPRDTNEQQKQKQKTEDFVVRSRRNNAAQVEEEIENLRRAIMVEKWMENYNTTAPAAAAAAIPRRHHSSNSGSSTDSSIFSSSETESSVFSRSSPSSKNQLITRTKSRAMKIYGDLKKVREPISPGGKIANFFNSIFSPKNPNKKQSMMEEFSSIRKSRSMRDTPTTSSLASKSCLIKNPSSSSYSSSTRCTKSKRSVRFCPVSVAAVHEDEYLVSASMPSINSRFIKKNVDTFRLYEEKNVRKHGCRGVYENESDDDDMSCASSDLFELENIGPVGIGAYDEELPVFGTTSLKRNQSIVGGFLL